MVIPSDPEQQKCGGIIDAARYRYEILNIHSISNARILRATLGQSSGTVKEVTQNLVLRMLEQSVVGEEIIIESGPITVYSKL